MLRPRVSGWEPGCIVRHRACDWRGRKASILKKVAAGKLRTVEAFTTPGQPMMYEAT
jgi:hypothetical protein